MHGKGRTDSGNPIKNRATENSEFNLQWKNTKIIPSQKQRVHLKQLCPLSP
jgi:hypothetical protein